MVNDLYIATCEMWKYVENTTMAETTETGCTSFIQHDVDDLGLVYMRGGRGRLHVSHLHVDELFGRGKMRMGFFVVGDHLEHTLPTRDLLQKTQCQHKIVPMSAQIVPGKAG